MTGLGHAISFVPLGSMLHAKKNTLAMREGMRMAWDAMQEHIVRTAGSSALRDGERLQRIYRDMTMGHGHFASLFGDVVARRIGQYRLGVEVVG